MTVLYILLIVVGLLGAICYFLPWRVMLLRTSKGQLLGWCWYNQYVLNCGRNDFEELVFDKKNADVKLTMIIEPNFYNDSLKKKAKNVARRVIRNLGEIENREKVREKDAYKLELTLEDAVINNKIIKIQDHFVVIRKQWAKSISGEQEQLPLKFYWFRKTSS